MPWEQLSGIIELARSNWHIAAQVLADLSTREQHPEAGVQIAEHFRSSASGEAVAEGLSQGYHEDVSAALRRIQAPALIVHRREDPIVPFELGQRLATEIPRARFVPLEGRIHAEFLGDSQLVMQAVRSFLLGQRERQPARPSGPAHAPVVVMFTDIEESTPMTQRLGDAQAQDVVRAHNTIVRDSLREHLGNEIKHTGDGIMASFASATQALECALDMKRAFGEHNRTAPAPLGVRIGLNAGEPIAEDEDLFGTAVQAARRICDQATPGEILVSNVVRELAAGKGFTFADRGETALKGFDEPFRLFEVRWQAAAPGAGS